jgi:spore maturation protein CgeB
LFFEPGKEILIAHSAEESLRYLMEISEPDRQWIAGQARERVLASHTARHRALELERYVLEAGGTPVARRQAAEVGPLKLPLGKVRAESRRLLQKQ